MQKTVADQGLFLLGGLDGNRVSGCTQDATTSNCAIPISVCSLFLKICAIIQWKS